MRNRRKTIAVAVILAMALAGGSFLTCGTGQTPPAKTAASSQLLSPFTGEPVAALGPTLAVKIDNIAASSAGPSAEGGTTFTAVSASR